MIGSPLETAPFDPTEPSSAEILGEWELAIQSMTFEQGMERVLCMFLRDREKAREHICDVWGDNWIQNDTLFMEKAFNKVHRNARFSDWISHYSHNNTVRIVDAENTRWVAVIYPPKFNDRGWPDTRFDKKDSFISVYSDERIISICDVDGETQFHAWHSSGRYPRKEDEFTAIVIECSQFFGLPVLPLRRTQVSIRNTVAMWKKPFVSDLINCPMKNSIDMDIRLFIKDVVPVEFRGGWSGVETWFWNLHFLDRFNPGWRERVRCTGVLWLEREKV
jgi:hypothetical protein